MFHPTFGTNSQRRQSGDIPSGVTRLAQRTAWQEHFIPRESSVGGMAAQIVRSWQACVYNPSSGHLRYGSELTTVTFTQTEDRGVAVTHTAGLLQRPVPRRLTLRWSGRVRDKVPSSYIGVRAAQLNR